MITISFMRFPRDAIAESMVFLVENGTPKVECWRVPYMVLDGIRKAIRDGKSYDMHPESQIGFIYPNASTKPLLCLGFDCYEVDIHEFKEAVESATKKTFRAKAVTFAAGESPFVRWAAVVLVDEMHTHDIEKMEVGCETCTIIVEKKK
jgi:hypothetical protein